MANDSGGAGDRGAVADESGDAGDGGSPLSDVDELFWKDEVLEATYWMVGEGIEDAVSPPDLRGFLDAPPGVVETTFERLEASDHLDETADGYVFTERGERAAKKRFADEFADVQGFTSAHTDCGPDCWCHDPDHAEDECPTDHDHDVGHGQGHSHTHQ